MLTDPVETVFFRRSELCAPAEYENDRLKLPTWLPTDTPRRLLVTLLCTTLHKTVESDFQSDASHLDIPNISTADPAKLMPLPTTVKLAAPDDAALALQVLLNDAAEYDKPLDVVDNK